ncbi:MAG: GAF domain-containing protein [Symploca sp. SIO2C1]|nr:GAF domain-containing protein [Symploca sp. SIO2C1]
MNTVWILFDIETLPIWQLIKQIKRILNLNKPSNPEELAKWRLPSDSLPLPPPRKGDTGTQGRGDTVIEREGELPSSPISNPQSSIEVLSSYPEIKPKVFPLSSPELLTPLSSQGKEKMSEVIPLMPTRSEMNSNDASGNTSALGVGSQRVGGDAQKEQRDKGDKEDKEDTSKILEEPNIQDLLANYFPSSSSSAAPRTPTPSPSPSQPPQPDIEVTKDITMQELKQSQHQSDSKSELEQPPSPSQGNGASTKSQAKVPMKLNQQLKSHRQWLFNLASQMREVNKPEGLYKLTVTELYEHLQVDRALIYRFQAHNVGVVVAESMKTGYTPSQGELLQVNAFGAEHQQDYEEKPAIILNDISQTVVTPHQLQLLEHFQVQASISLPIWLGEDLWGLLVLQQCSRPRQWQEVELILLSSITTELAMNLQPLEFRYRRQELARQEVILGQILEKTQPSSDTYIALANLAQELRRYYKADRVTFYRFYPDWSGEFIAESVAAGWNEVLKQQKEDPSLIGKERINYDRCVVKTLGSAPNPEMTDTLLKDTQGGSYFQGKQLKQVDDIYAAGFSNCYIASLEKYQARAYMIAPIFYGDQLWGLLGVYQNSAPRRWQDAETILLSMIGDRLTSILKQLDYLSQLETTSEQLRKEAEQDRLLSKISERILQSSEGETIFQSTVREVRRFLNADRVGVFRFEPNSNQSEGKFIAEDVHLDHFSALSSPIKDHCFGENMAEQYLQGRHWACNDIYQAELPDCHIEILSKFQVRANLVMPLIKGDQLWGLLCIHQCTSPREWQPSEIAFAKQIAHQFSLNFQKLKYTEKLRSQSEQIALSAEGERIAATLLDKLRNTTGGSNFLQSVTRVVRQQLKCDRVAVYRFNPDWSGEYVVESMSQTWLPLVGATIEPDHLQETQGGRYRHHETLVVDDIHQDVCEGLGELLEKFETQALITVPIFQGEKLWGLLSAHHNSRPRHWDVAEVSMLAQIGRQFLATLQQAEYLEQLTQAADSERLAFRMIQKIRKTSDTASVFQNIAQEVRQRLKCDRVAVYHFNDDWSGTFVAESVTSDWVRLVDAENPIVCEDTYLQENQGGQYRENETLVVDDIYQAGFSDCYVELLEQFQAKAYLIVPIFQNEKLWGLFAAYQNSGSRHWEAGEVNFLTRIGRQFGIALQQVEYIEQLQVKSRLINKTVTAERAADRIIDKIRKNLEDLDNVFRLSTEAVRQYLKCDRVAIYHFDDNWSGKFVAEAVGKGWVPLVGRDIETIWEDTHLQETQGGRYSKNETFAVDDIYQAGHFPCHMDILEQFQIRAYIIVPIFQGQKLWGLFSAYQNSGPRHWEQPEVAMLNRIGQQFGIAIQQTEYIDQLRTTSNQLAQAIELEKAAVNLINSRQSLNRETIFQATVIEVRQLLKADRVAVFRFYPDSGFDDGEMVAEDVVAGYKSALDIKVHDHCFGEQYAPYYAQGKVQAVTDIYNMGLSDCHIEILAKFQVRANLIVPLLKNMELWGLLCIHQCSGPRQWQDIEIEFAKQIAGQLGVALQQTDYVEQLQAKSNQITKTIAKERAAARVIDKMRKASEVDSLFRITTQEIRLQLKCDRVAVYTFNPDWTGKFVAESVGAGWVTLVSPDVETIWEDTYLQENQGGRYSRQESLTVDDIYQMNYAPCHIDNLEQIEAKAYVIAPIFKGEKLWGLLAIYQNSGPRHWEENEVRFLAQIALQFGVALQQTEYVEQLQIQSVQLAKAADLERGAITIINNIRQTQNLKQIFQTATQEIRQLLKADRVGVYRFEPGTNYDFGEFVAENVDYNYTSALEVKVEDHCFGEKHSEKYRNGAIFAAADIYQVGLLDCHIATLEQFQIRANLVVPMLKDRELWGLLCIFQCSGPRQWEDNEIDFAQQIAAQLGVALQQAEYIEQLQKQSNQMSKTAQREKGVAQIIARLLQSQDMTTTLRTTTQEVRHLLKCDRTAVYRFHPNGSGEFVAESVNSDWLPVMGSELQTVWLDRNLPATLEGKYQQQETLIVDDIYQYDHSPSQIEILEQFKAKAYLVVPVFQGDKLWGLLSAYQNNEPRHWEVAEVSALAQIGLQMGAALQQVSYLEQVQQQSEQLTKLAERETNFINLIDTIGQRIAERLRQRNFNTESLFRATTQELREILQADRVAVYRFHADWSGEFVMEALGGDYLKLVGTEAALVADPILQESQGSIYRLNEVSAVSDIRKADNLTFSKELLQEWGVKAYVIAPMFKGDQLWGLLVTQQNSQTRDWEQSEVNLLVQMARQLGIVLQQAESFERIQKQSQQLKEVASREKADKQALQEGVVQLLTAVRPALSGDLTVRAPVTEDEVGTVADAYNNTLQSLRTIVKQVQASSRQVTQTSQESDKAIAGLTTQAQQQFESLTQALEQIQTMVNSTEAVATNAQQVEAAVQQANQTVSQGDTAMNRTVDGILDIRETVAETSKRLKRLSESSQKVSRVVNLISNFTTQTQLLALNASIEATRAGEYGRGFVVVADEVRSLARQSAEATTEIAELVQEIQAGTAEVSQVMETGIQQVAQGTNLVNDTRQTLNAIVEATAKISQLVEGITQATQVQTQEFQSVTETMTEVAGIANQTSAEATEISSSFKELLAMSQELQVSADRFTVD